MTNGQQYYKRLIEPIEQQMISVIGRIVRNSDEAMDVLHNALATIWSKLDKIDKLTNPHAYILRICVTHAYDALRNAKSRRYHESQAFFQRSDGWADQSVNGDNDEQFLKFVYEAIRMLPRKQAKCFLLRAVDDFSFLEIANILNCSEPTARSHYSKARVRIYDILRKRGVLDSDGKKKYEAKHSF